MKLLLSILFITSLSGCIIERSTSYRGVFVNKTAHTIEVKTFRNGVNTPNLTLTILPNSETLFADGTDRGLNDVSAGFNSEAYGGDSVHVVFEGTYLMVHYGAAVRTSPKYYEQTHPRSLNNASGWLITTPVDKKYRRSHEYRFTFIDQDYLDAQ